MEGLEELRESLWELWEGAGGDEIWQNVMEFDVFRVQNDEFGVRRCVSA